MTIRMSAVRRAAAALAALALVVTPGSVAAAAAHPPSGATTAASGAPYPCTTSDSANFQSGTGLGVDVSAIGWLGNDTGVTACLGGSFFVQDGVNQTYGYGVYDDAPTTWTNVDGWLPALETRFAAQGANVSITNFGDAVTIGGHRFVLIYSRVAVQNPTSAPLTVNPEATPGLVPLDHASDTVAPGETVDHDYVVAGDRFGGTYAWPTPAQMAGAGGWAAHFAHMRAFWDAEVAGITQLSLPDSRLVDAYQADFAYTQIDRSGIMLDTGTNGYHAEYEHDVIGILANMFNEGDFQQAHALLERADTVVGTNGQYADGLWTYPWLWSVYLEKTGDLAFVKAHFARAGPGGPTVDPSIEQAAHQTVADRTGPGGIMEETSDIDANGYWTSDNYEALLGLGSYAELARAVGDAAEYRWAVSEYRSLQSAVDRTLAATTATYHLDYLPCSMVEPNTDNRCGDPLDANWAAPGVYTNYAWHAYLVGAPVNGPAGRSMASWLNATMRYGFGRTKGILPPATFGGYPGEGFWSTGYNAGYGAWGLGSTEYRDESILSYEFLLADDQAGPYAWWEGSAPPTSSTPWVGNHPAASGGACPHSWGIALAAQGLLDSLASQRTDGTLIVGRGVPNDWLAAGKTISMTNFPTTDGHRLGLRISSTGRAVTLTLAGRPSGPVVFDLPAFVDNVASASTGTVNEQAGTVTVPATTSSVRVQLDRLELTPAATTLRIAPAAATTLAPGASTTVTATLADAGPGSLGRASLSLSAPAGWRVTAVSGTTSGAVPAGTSVTGTWTVRAPAGSGTSVTAALQAGATYTDATTHRVMAVTSGQLGVPTVTSVAPTTVFAGELVTIGGSNFGPSQGSAGYVQFTDNGTTWGQIGDEAALSIRSWGDHRIQFYVPTPTGGPSGGEYQVVPGTTATVQVFTAGGSSAVTDLAVAAPPG